MKIDTKLIKFMFDVELLTSLSKNGYYEFSEVNEENIHEARNRVIYDRSAYIRPRNEIETALYKIVEYIHVDAEHHDAEYFGSEDGDYEIGVVDPNDVEDEVDWPLFIQITFWDGSYILIEDGVATFYEKV